MTEGKTFTQAEVDQMLNSERDKTQTWMAKATDFEKRFNGIDPEEAKANKAALDQIKKDKAAGDPKEVDKLITDKEAELREKVFKPELEKRDGRISKLESELKELRVVETAFSKVTGKLYDKAADDFKAHVRATCDVDDEGNIIVKGTDGKPRYSAKNASQKMTIDEYIEELMGTRDHWFLNKTAAGSHSGGEKFSGQAAEMTFEQFARLSDADQKAILPKIPEAKRDEFINRAFALGS